MTTTFTLTADDFVRLQKAIVRRFRARSPRLTTSFFLYFFVWMIVGLAASSYAGVMRDYPDASRRLAEVAVMLGVALVALLAQPYLNQLLMRRRFIEPEGSFLAPQTVWLTTEALHVSSRLGKGEIPWSAFVGREDDEVNYYLFVDVLQAVVLPRAELGLLASQIEQHTAHLKRP
jgi:hypothetical protein